MKEYEEEDEEDEEEEEGGGGDSQRTMHVTAGMGFLGSSGFRSTGSVAAD